MTSLQKIIISNNRSDIPNNILIERELIREKLDQIKKSSPLPLRKYIQHLYVNESSRSVNVNTALRYAREISKYLDWCINEYLSSLLLNGTEYCDIEDIDYDYIQDYLDNLGSYSEINEHGQKVIHNKSLNTIAFKKTSIQQFYNWMYTNEHISRNEALKLRKTAKSTAPPILTMTDDEVKAMLELCKSGSTFIYDNEINLSSRELGYNKKNKYRDLAILSLFVYHGLRIHELYHLNIESLDTDKDIFNIYRKRNKKAIMYFSQASKEAVQNYIKYERNVNVKKYFDDSNPLFINYKDNERLSLRQIRRIVKKYTVKVTNNSKISPHKLRATLATKALRTTNNIFDVQQMLDHSNPVTTERYLQANEESKREIASLINY